MDCHGHGESEPRQRAKRCTVLSFQHVIDDAAEHLRAVVQPLHASLARAAAEGGSGKCAQLPLVLAGLSMGAHVATTLGARFVSPRTQLPPPAGLMLLSCVPPETRRRLTLPLVSALRRVAPTLVVSRPAPRETPHANMVRARA